MLTFNVFLRSIALLACIVFVGLIVVLFICEWLECFIRKQIKKLVRHGALELNLNIADWPIEEPFVTVARVRELINDALKDKLDASM